MQWLFLCKKYFHLHVQHLSLGIAFYTHLAYKCSTVLFLFVIVDQPQLESTLVNVLLYQDINVQ